MLCVAMPSVYAECPYSEYLNAKRLYAKCFYAECPYAEYLNAKRLYTKCLASLC